ncbi:hypothetical protein HC231_18315 [Brenneria izadpanahii]|uniref:Uncharacterized protein n=1 Tax=Brenneria izadpanahii TaxID=2722756 RepID=A0ABX7UVC5_9GAMM|nr:hypothetical protein [Brenneria izadpanahii]QTF09656.1 hypothetical protein HC231_18315 [Brenneria izadpanahii]
MSSELSKYQTAFGPSQAGNVTDIIDKVEKDNQLTHNHIHEFIRRYENEHGRS